MRRPRAAQFGKDIGVSTSEAKQLINEGRKRQDGGSATLENNMNRMNYEKGGVKALKQAQAERDADRLVYEDTFINTDRSVSDPRPTLEDQERDKKYRDRKSPMRSSILKEAYPEEVEKYMKGKGKKKERKAAMGTYVSASDGKYMSCRGMGAAVQGGKFTGTK